MKTIYNTYVVMESQEQCDRIKQLCIDNGLSYWYDEDAFEYSIKENPNNSFAFGIGYEFYVGVYIGKNEQITEQEFIELLKTTK